jgi:hypothetical protein
MTVHSCYPCVLQTYYAPYEVFELNKLEFYSLFTSFLTLLSGVFFSLDKETPVSWRVPITWFILVINCITFTRIAVAFFHAVYLFMPSHLRRKVRHKLCCCLRRRYRKALERAQAQVEMTIAGAGNAVFEAVAEQTFEEMAPRSKQNNLSQELGAVTMETKFAADDDSVEVELILLLKAEHLHAEVIQLHDMLIHPPSVYSGDERVRSECVDLKVMSGNLVSNMVLDMGGSTPRLEDLKRFHRSLVQLETRFAGGVRSMGSTPSFMSEGNEESSSDDSEDEERMMKRKSFYTNRFSKTSTLNQHLEGPHVQRLQVCCCVSLHLLVSTFICSLLLPLISIAEFV